MKRIKNLLAIGAFSLLVLGIPAIASAQYNGGNDPYGRNGGYNNGGYNNGQNGQYGNYGNNGDIRSAIRDLKDSSHRFEKDLDRSSTYSKNGNGNYGGYGNNGSYGNNGGYNDDRSRSNVRKLADKFGRAADKLDDKFGNGRNINNSYNEANRVLDLGSQLGNELNNRGMDGYLQGEWNRMQNDLRVVANYYNNGNYRNTGNNRNYPNNGNRGNNRNNPWGNGNKPSWWPF